MNYGTFDKFVCAPFEENSVKTEAVGSGEIKAYRVKNTKSKLVPLRVLVDALIKFGERVETIPAGTSVLVRASDYAMPWAQDVLTAEGWVDEQDGKNEPVKFILVPTNRVEMFGD